MDNIKGSESPNLSNFVNRYSHFLAEARKRLLFTLVVFILATIGGFSTYDKIIRFMVGFLSLEGINIVFTSPFQFINIAVACGVATGILVTLPLIIFQVLSFLKPALKNIEFGIITRFLPFSVVLFFVGFFFGAIIMKWQIRIFLEQSFALGISNVLDISSLLTVVLLTSVFLGIAFQFPIALLVFMRLGFVKHKQVSKARKWVYLLAFLFAIILPANSILADILLSLPLIILFEVTLLLNRIMGKKEN